MAVPEWLAPPALAESVAQDPRVAPSPLLDKGFAATRKIGDGVYATIADMSKGPQAVSNGGFLSGKDAALLIEGHLTPAGAALEIEALRMVSQAPIRGAVNTHYHFDHTFGNAHYGAQGIPIWAHARASALITERYAALQGKDNSALLAPIEKRLRDAKSDTARERAQGDLNVWKWIITSVESAALTLPNHPLDPAKLPMTVDLGGLKAVLETHPGHSPTDVIVRVPEQNLTFAGDLLFDHSYPVAFDADMRAWRAVMKTFAGYGQDALFVPGHGQVCGQDWIAQQIAVMDDIGQHAEKLFKAGVPAAEAANRYSIPEKFKGLWMLSWWFCIESAIGSYYKGFTKVVK